MIRQLTRLFKTSLNCQAILIWPKAKQFTLGSLFNNIDQSGVMVDSAPVVSEFYLSLLPIINIKEG